jgi:hypothetical protein
MNKLSYITPFIFLGFFSLNTNCQDSLKKIEAKVFYLNIVELIIKNDCQGYINSYADSVKIISPVGDTLMSNSFLRKSQSFCNEISKLLPDSITLENYESDYDIIILNKSEYTNPSIYDSLNIGLFDNRLVCRILTNYKDKYSEDDYLVIGNKRKDNDESKIMRESLMFVYVIRYKNEKWEILGSIFK